MLAVTASASLTRPVTRTCSPGANAAPRTKPAIVPPMLGFPPGAEHGRTTRVAAPAARTDAPRQRSKLTPRKTSVKRPPGPGFATCLRVVVPAR